MSGTSTTEAESCSESGNMKELRPQNAVEMGYLYLERSTILVLSSDETPSMPCGKWIDVEAESAPEDEAESISSDGRGEYCSRCDLVVKASETGTDLSPLTILKNRTFDGTIKDLTCPCVRQNPKRSDAALLMGLAVACQDLDHILIQSVRVRLLDQRDYLDMQQDSETGSSTRDTKDDSTKITHYDASLVITFAVPNLEGDNVQRSIQPREKLKRGASSKPLPACTQLLLSIVRSDWGRLDQIMRHDRDGVILMSHSARKETPSLFPKKLSLEEVFQRINGAATILSSLDPGEFTSSLLNMKQQDTSRVDILNLPKDVLVDKVACYLRASSLDAFRCSCKYLHHMLRSVVPGLNLRLYSHQVKSLSWMRLREKLLVESELLLPTQYRALFPDGDPHRVVSGGATTLLRARTGDGVRICQYAGDEVHLAIDEPLSRTVARGGLLCDDPGLGKTITVLSLVLQTLGLSTEVPASVHESEEAQDNVISDDQIFAEYWKEQVVPEFRRRALTRLVAEFLRCDRDADYFVLPVVPEQDGCSDYFDVIKRPICFRAIRKKVDRDEYGDSFVMFESDAILCFRNATLYHTPDSPVHVAARRVLSIFETMVEQFKADQLHAAKKSFARASVKPNSAVAALIETRNRTLFLQSLVPSSGTLLVVPSVLIEHWQDQLRLHVDIKYVTRKIPLVFEYTGTAQCGLRMEDFVIKCKVKNTHAAFAFIDKTGTKKLPSPEFLAMFRIVITTNQRFTNEWKNGSFEEELKRKTKAESQDEFGFRDSMTTSEEACPLLKVNWLRMVVDEGHSMGKGKDNSAICFASWISAERRWAMTGTPTRQTASQSGLSNILGLMRYLQHDFFSRRREGEAVWQNMIARSWNHGCLSAFARLRSLLSLLMVRHTKMDIEELPPPHFRTSVLPMSYEEVTTYNTLVCAVQSNLLITSMEGKTSGAQDSLLHRSQAKHAKDALRNVRLVCSGGTRVIPTLSQIFWNEFFAEMSAFAPPEHKMTEIKHYLHRAVMEQLSPCNCCGMMLSTLLVYPCGDLVCTECADHRSNCCVVCDKEFNVDGFQRLQPGMDYQWLHNIEEESKKKKVDVATAANESDENPLDPSAPDHDIFLVHGAGNLVPLDPERQRRRTRKFGDGHTCEYDRKCTTGECTLCWKEHDICNLLNRFSRCQTCFRTAEKCPESESKSSYIIDRLLKLCDTQQEEEHRRSSRAASLTIGEEVTFKATRKLKVIVFSQFRKVLNMIGDRLLRRFGTACVAEYWGKFRKQELHKFIYSDECFCMLLGKDGSEGLDLSFVTHIFFIEQVWDKSLEHQAVARAWRMGAKGSVEVETLIAENSVEETMRKLEHSLEHRNHHTATVGNPDDLMSESSSGKNADYQRAKLQFLLKGLELIKNSYTLPFRGNKRKVEVAEEVASTLVASPFATKKKAKGSRSRVRFKL